MADEPWHGRCRRRPAALHAARNSVRGLSPAFAVPGVRCPQTMLTHSGIERTVHPPRPSRMWNRGPNLPRSDLRCLVVTTPMNGVGCLITSSRKDSTGCTLSQARLTTAPEHGRRRQPFPGVHRGSIHQSPSGETPGGHGAKTRRQRKWHRTTEREAGRGRLTHTQPIIGHFRHSPTPGSKAARRIIAEENEEESESVATT